MTWQLCCWQDHQHEAPLKGVYNNNNNNNNNNDNNNNNNNNNNKDGSSVYECLSLRLKMNSRTLCWGFEPIWLIVTESFNPHHLLFVLNNILQSACLLVLQSPFSSLFFFKKEREMLTCWIRMQIVAVLNARLHRVVQGT